MNQEFRLQSGRALWSTIRAIGKNWKSVFDISFQENYSQKKENAELLQQNEGQTINAALNNEFFFNKINLEIKYRKRGKKTTKFDLGQYILEPKLKK